MVRTKIQNIPGEPTWDELFDKWMPAQTTRPSEQYIQSFCSHINRIRYQNLNDGIKWDTEWNDELKIEDHYNKVVDIEQIDFVNLVRTPHSVLQPQVHFDNLDLPTDLNPIIDLHDTSNSTLTNIASNKNSYFQYINSDFRRSASWRVETGKQLRNLKTSLRHSSVYYGNNLQIKILEECAKKNLIKKRTLEEIEQTITYFKGTYRGPILLITVPTLAYFLHYMYGSNRIFDAASFRSQLLENYDVINNALSITNRKTYGTVPETSMNSIILPLSCLQVTKRTFSHLDYNTIGTAYNLISREIRLLSVNINIDQNFPIRQTNKDKEIEDLSRFSQVDLCDIS